MKKRLLAFGQIPIQVTANLKIQNHKYFYISSALSQKIQSQL